jgi:hypothetical protein
MSEVDASVDEREGDQRLRLDRPSTSLAVIAAHQFTSPVIGRDTVVLTAAEV